VESGTQEGRNKRAALPDFLLSSSVTHDPAAPNCRESATHEGWNKLAALPDFLLSSSTTYDPAGCRRVDGQHPGTNDEPLSICN
jgi:hypothetical protein